MKTQRKNNPNQKVEPKNPINWDLIIKAIGALVAIFGVFFGIYQYNQSRIKDKQASIESKKKQQYEHYIKATNIASRFAQASTKQEADETRKQFWGIYNGELSIVEDENVKQAMMNFGGAVERWEKYNTPSSDFSPPSIFELEDSKGEPLTFSQLAYQLSQACRQSLEK